MTPLGSSAWEGLPLLALPWATILLFTESGFLPPALLNFPNSSHIYDFTQFTFQHEVVRAFIDTAEL